MPGAGERAQHPLPGTHGFRGEHGRGAGAHAATPGHACRGLCRLAPGFGAPEPAPHGLEAQRPLRPAAALCSGEAGQERTVQGFGYGAQGLQP